MTTKDLPEALQAAQFEWGIQKAGLQFTGPYNGTRQSVEFASDRWVCGVSLPPRARARAGSVEAFLNWLCGGVNRVRLAHLGSGVRRDPFAPRGTLRGTPTLGVAAVRGNTTLSFANCAPGATLLAGDMVSCGQLFQIAEDATANGAGVMAVELVGRVRSPLNVATAIVWNKPTAEFVMPAQSARHSHVPAILLGAQFDLEEVW